MKRNYLGFVTQLHRNYGDLSYMRLGKEHAWDLMSPELVREALIRWERGIAVFAQAHRQRRLDASWAQGPGMPSPHRCTVAP